MPSPKHTYEHTYECTDGHIENKIHPVGRVGAEGIQMRLFSPIETKKAVCHNPRGVRQGAHLPNNTPRAHTTKVRDTWPVYRQTWVTFPAAEHQLPLDRYQIILPGDRGTCMRTTCPRLLSESRTAASQTSDQWVTSPTPWPLHQKTTLVVRASAINSLSALAVLVGWPERCWLGDQKGA